MNSKRDLRGDRSVAELRKSSLFSDPLLPPRGGAFNGRHPLRLKVSKNSQFGILEPRQRCQRVVDEQICR